MPSHHLVWIFSHWSFSLSYSLFSLLFTGSYWPPSNGSPRCSCSVDGWKVKYSMAPRHHQTTPHHNRPAQRWLLWLAGWPGGSRLGAGWVLAGATPVMSSAGQQGAATCRYLPLPPPPPTPSQLRTLPVCVRVLRLEDLSTCHKHVPTLYRHLPSHSQHPTR